MGCKHYALLVLLAAGTCLTGAASTVLAQQEAERKPSAGADAAKQEVGAFWDPSTILRTATRNLARRYNLNDEQADFTDHMMSSRVTRFLERHHDEIWPLLREMVLIQRSGKMPDAELAKELGPRALKIIKEAKEEILKSNEEWREVLSEEQKRVHDFDLREMSKTFAAMESNFEGWAKGDPQSSSLFPAARPLKGQPPLPTKPTPGLDKKERKKIDLKVRGLGDEFDRYAEEFIKRYQLTAPQVETAQSILRELKERGTAFETANRDQIRELNDKIINAKEYKDRRLWRAKLTELRKPLNDLFVELKNRLEPIPDQAQRERAAVAAERPSSAIKVSGVKSRRTSQPEKKGKSSGSSEDEP